MTRNWTAPVGVPAPGALAVTVAVARLRAAVIVRAEGTKVALVDAAGAVRYRPVRVGRDFGQTVEILDGLVGGESIIIRPGDDLPEGTIVDVVGGSGK